MLTCFKRRCQFGEWGSQLELLAEWQHVMHLKPHAQQLHVTCNKVQSLFGKTFLVAKDLRIQGAMLGVAAEFQLVAALATIDLARTRARYCIVAQKHKASEKGTAAAMLPWALPCFSRHWEYKFMARWLITSCVKVYTRPNKVNTQNRKPGGNSISRPFRIIQWPLLVMSSLSSVWCDLWSLQIVHRTRFFVATDRSTLRSPWACFWSWGSDIKVTHWGDVLLRIWSLCSSIGIWQWHSHTFSPDLGSILDFWSLNLSKILTHMPHVCATFNWSPCHLEVLWMSWPKFRSKDVFEILFCLCCTKHLEEKSNNVYNLQFSQNAEQDGTFLICLSDANWNVFTEASNSREFLMEAWKCKLKRKLRVSSCWSQGGGPNRVKPLPWITWMIRECSCIFLRNKAQEWISNEVFCIFLELIREEKSCWGRSFLLDGVLGRVRLFFLFHSFSIFNFATCFHFLRLWKGRQLLTENRGTDAWNFGLFLVFIKRSSCISLSNMLGRRFPFPELNCPSSDYRPRLFDWWTLKRSVDRLSATWLYATRSGRSRNFRMTKIPAEIQSELLFQCRIGIRPTNAGFEFHC